jgi:Cof subfamily protein (haloacid dehalogenase superfamily)
MRYRMRTIDLDGTLLGRRGRISAENLAAVAAAQEAGWLVVPCTGRAWRESWTVLKPLRNIDLGVFVTGAVVGEISTGKSLDIAVIEPHMALELVRYLEHLPEAVLVFREASLCGHDYLVTGHGTLPPATLWWFESTESTVHYQKQVTVEDLHHTLRVGVVAAAKRVVPLTHELRDRFKEKVLVQSVEAIQAADPGQEVHILEVFAAGVDKWRGIEWIAGERGIEPSQIVAIGDQINDLAMLQAAGCSIAMGNAVDAVKRSARYVTLDCDEHGVAHAIRMVLDGKWG